MQNCTVFLRTAVTDVKFSPVDVGLMFATVSADGMARVYECPDVMTITDWPQKHEVQTGLTTLSCVAWMPGINK